MAASRNHNQLPSLTFWHFHIAGWLLFWCGDIALILLQHISPALILAQALDAPLGFTLGLALRRIFARVNYTRLSIPRLIAIILFWSIAFACVWHALMTGTRYILLGERALSALWNISYTLRWLSQITPIWLGWSTLYFGIKYWRDMDAERKRAHDALVLARKARLQMLRYQVNPHFLFNALNSVRALIGEDSRSARAMITELSELLRYSLVDRDDGEVPLQQELDAVRHYLSIEKKRFDENLDVAFAVDEEANHLPILSFLLHPFVENAVKYGMRTSPMPLRIRIQACARHNGLRIAISNSGSWLDGTKEMEHSAEGTGTGLENVRARLDNAYPNRYRLELMEHDGWVDAILEIDRPSGGS